MAKQNADLEVLCYDHIVFLVDDTNKYLGKTVTLLTVWKMKALFAFSHKTWNWGVVLMLLKVLIFLFCFISIILKNISLKIEIYLIKWFMLLWDICVKSKEFNEIGVKIENEFWDNFLNAVDVVT